MSLLNLVVKSRVGFRWSVLALKFLFFLKVAEAIFGMEGVISSESWGSEISEG
jgi:hypothetical protein